MNEVFKYTDIRIFNSAESSALQYLYYDAKDRRLAVKWRNGSTCYIYDPCDKAVFDEIVNATSPGSAASRILSELSRNWGRPEQVLDYAIDYVSRPVSMFEVTDEEWGGTAKYEVRMNVSGTIKLKVEAKTIADAVSKVNNEIVNKMFENSEIDIVKVERIFE